MALTFETALAKIKKNEIIADLWEGWPFYSYNENQLSIGMLPLFLCDVRVKILKVISKSTYYALLEEMAAFAAAEEPQSLVITPSLGKPDLIPVSPLWEAILKKDSKAVDILLKYTPAEGINREIYPLELDNRKMTIHYMFPRALYAGIDRPVLYRLLKKTTCIEALDEALAQTTFRDKDHIDGMSGYGRDVIRGEIHTRIQKRKDEILNPQPKGWGASFVSLFTGDWGSKQPVGKLEVAVCEGKTQQVPG